MGRPSAKRTNPPKKFTLPKTNPRKTTTMTRFIESIFQLPPPVRREPLTLEIAGVTYPDSAYRIHRPNGSSGYVLEYIIRGRGQLHMMDHSWKPQAGDVYVLPPGIPHEYFSEPSDPWEKVWFNVNGELLDKLFATYDIGGTVVFPQCPLRREFEEGLEIVKHRKPDAYAELALSMPRIIAGLARWKERYPANARSPEGIKLKEHLDAHWRRNVPLEELCSLIRRSRAQTLRIFRRDWETTPHAYLQSQRFRLAEEYLKNTDYSVKAIADLIGFDDEFYFSNWFREKNGLSPRNFRAQLRADTK